MNDIRKTCVGWSLALVVLAAPVLVRADQTPPWKSLGPDGGLAAAVAVHPTTPSTVICGLQNGGLYRTTNGGVSWRAVGRGVVDPDVLCLFIPKKSPGTVYAGTMNGIYKSPNAGATWISANGDLLAERAVYGVAVHPTSPNIVWAATAGHGIYKSTNGGVSWKWISNSLSYKDVWTLAIDKNGILYAGVGDEGLYKSANGGASWTFLGKGGYVRAFAVDPVDPRIMTLIANASWRSTDGGATWTDISGWLPGSPMAVAANQKTAGTLYLGTYNDGIFKSVDGAATWTALNTGLTDLQVRQLAVAPSLPATIFAGTLVGGLFKSGNGGGQWAAVNKGIRAHNVRDIAFDGKTAGLLYAGTSTGFFKGTGGGSAWKSLNKTPFNREAGCESAVVDPRNPKVLYAGSYYQGMFKTTDGGAAWTKLSLSVRVESVVLDPSNPDRVFVVSYWSGVFRSSNAGQTWTKIGFGTASPSGLAFDPSQPGAVYVWAANGLWRGTATGSGWKSVGLKEYSLYNLTFDRDGVLYAGTGGEGVLKSVDHGVSWTKMNNGLPSCRYIDAFTIDPQNSLNLYAGVSDLGIYRSKDGGQSWTFMGAGLCPNVMVFKLAFDPVDKVTLYAGSQGAGVYKVKPGS